MKSIPGDFEVSDTNLGFALGGGFQFKGSKAPAIYAEAMYHFINGEAENTEFAMLTFGVLFSFN